MMVVRLLAFGLFGVLAAGEAVADWSGQGRFGAVIARGNTETATGNVNIDLANQLDAWRHKFGGTMLRTVNEEVTSADRWELRAESEYEPTKRVFYFGSLRYEDDRFTDFSYQAVAAIGVGYHFIDTAITQFDGRIGVGTRRTQLRATDEEEADEIVRGQLEWKRQMTENTIAFNRLLVESGVVNTFVQNVLGLEVKMNDRWSIGLGYEVRHNTEVLPGTEKTDQVFTAGLGMAF
jgi:putative salt-induced outer membrane protein